MKNPFKTFGSPNPSQYSGSRSSNKLIIVAEIVTFVVITSARNSVFVLLP